MNEKKIALILNILNRKVSICRDFLSLYRSTGGTPRLHEVTISICSCLKRKVFICRDFLSLYRSTGGTPRLHEVTISICVEWINIALILNILNRKVFICRDALSLYRCTGGTPRLHEVTISICSWMNKYSVHSKHFKPEKSLYEGISSPSNGLEAARPDFLMKSIWARTTTRCKDYV